MDIKEFEEKVDEFIKSFTKEEMIKILKENGFEVIENEKQGKWKPKAGEVFWFGDTYGEICSTKYSWITNENILKNTLVFQTKGECEKYWEFRNAVKEKSYEFSEKEWEDSDKPKYYIDYTYSLKKFDIEKSFCCKQAGSIYFKTAKNAQYIIDNYKEQLLKYWL